MPHAVVRHGQENLAAEQLRQYEAALQGYFTRRVPVDQVDDLVQETLIRLFAPRPAETLQTPLAYLCRIASNLLADHLRR